MQITEENIAPSLPFALLQHEDASIEAEKSLGNPYQDWSWKPEGLLDPEGFAVYATNGQSTTKQTWAGQWDHGEWN